MLNNIHTYIHTCIHTTGDATLAAYDLRISDRKYNDLTSLRNKRYDTTDCCFLFLFIRKYSYLYVLYGCMYKVDLFLYEHQTIRYIILSLKIDDLTYA